MNRVERQSKTARSRRAQPPKQVFVQTMTKPSLGVELSSGRGWVGVDQQVGHGSADALYAMPDEMYAASIAAGYVGGTFEAECWRGEHPDLQLYDPAKSSRIEHWNSLRPRLVPSEVRGEIWWLLDALGDAPGGERLGLAQALAAGTLHTEFDDDGLKRLTVDLSGDRAYPRPTALFAATAGTRASEAFGRQDAFSIEGHEISIEHTEAGTTRLVINRAPFAAAPVGDLRTFLHVIGAPEEGTEFQAAARLAGSERTRWQIPSRPPRSLLQFAGGIDMQVEDARVVSVRVLLHSTEPVKRPHSAPKKNNRGPAVRHSDLEAREAYPHADSLFGDSAGALSRGELHSLLGTPAAEEAAFDLYHYRGIDMVIEYGISSHGETPRTVCLSLSSTYVSPKVRGWRSGEFALFLDALGLDQNEPLVASIRSLPGVQLSYRADQVSSIEIGTNGNQSERFKAFVDGAPANPRRDELGFGAPQYHGEHDDLREYEQGWIHVRSRDGVMIDSITVSEEPPDGKGMRRWMFRDEWPPRSS